MHWVKFVPTGGRDDDLLTDRHAFPSGAPVLAPPLVIAGGLAARVRKGEWR